MNGVHTCMAGAVYIVDIEGKTLTYEGGASPMFEQDDFLWVSSNLDHPSVLLLQNITGFRVEYSDLCTPNFEKVVLDYDFENPKIKDLIRFAKSVQRIVPNSWECFGKTVISKIIGIAFEKYVNNNSGRDYYIEDEYEKREEYEKMKIQNQ